MAKLYFHHSTMNAGKSTLLLQASYNYRERGMATLLLTAGLDTRAGASRIGSRIGISAEALAFGPTTDLFALIAEQGAGAACIFVDEAQFLAPDQVWQLARVADDLVQPVMAYGLRTDFRGELFAGSQHLLAWADEISEIKTICHSGSKATMTVRVDANGRAVQDGPQVEIGGNDRYVSVSRAEFKKVMRGEGSIEPLQAPLPLPR